MKGYWKKPAETEKQFVGDFLRTGDVAIMDEHGFFSIVDRIKDLIICSGYNVYPRRIEEAIYQHPAVEEVTVIGIPDDYRGEAPKAFIKLKNGMTATAADILKHLEPKISKIEMPVADRISRQPAEDDDRQALEKRACRRRGQTRQTGMSDKATTPCPEQPGRRSCRIVARTDLFDFGARQGIRRSRRAPSASTRAAASSRRNGSARRGATRSATGRG